MMEQREGSDSVQAQGMVCITGQPRGAEAIESAPRSAGGQLWVTHKSAQIHSAAVHALCGASARLCSITCMSTSTSWAPLTSSWWSARRTAPLRRNVCGHSSHQDIGCADVAEPCADATELNMTADQLHSLRVSYTYGGSFSGFLAQLGTTTDVITSSVTKRVLASTTLPSCEFAPTRFLDLSMPPKCRARVPSQRSREIRGGGNEDILQIAALKS